MFLCLNESMDNSEDNQEEAAENTCQKIDKEMLVRRPRKYTISPEVIEQRREAGKHKKGEAVTKNAWKHGRYSKEGLQALIPPCKTTCKDYPCDLVKEGLTRAGHGPCLDKQEVIGTFDAIMKALKADSDEDREDFLGQLAFMNAQNFQIVKKIQAALLEDGVMVRERGIDREGLVIDLGVKQHPLLRSLTKICGELGITIRDLVLTPKERAKAKTDEQGAENLANFLRGVSAKSQDKEG